MGGYFSGKALIDHHPLNCKLFYVKREIKYYADDGRIFTVKPGWLTDGASFPTRLLGCPFAGCYLESAILHDLLYRTQTITRFDADNLFLESANYSNVQVYTKSKMYLGVRVGGWNAWRKNKSTIKDYTKYLEITNVEKD